MKNFIPNSYKKNIADIDYLKLKKIGIKCLIFDLDNTLGKIDDEIISKDNMNLLNKLKKSFKIVIISNNSKKRISKFCDPLKVDYVYFALKPLTHGFRKIRRKNKYEKKQMCMIGDQLMTDIFGANKYGLYTILVDPIAKKDLKITSLNRILENNIIKKLSKKNILERGKYYE